MGKPCGRVKICKKRRRGIFGNDLFPDHYSREKKVPGAKKRILARDLKTLAYTRARCYTFPFPLCPRSNPQLLPLLNERPRFLGYWRFG